MARSRRRERAFFVLAYALQVKATSDRAIPGLSDRERAIYTGQLADGEDIRKVRLGLARDYRSGIGVQDARITDLNKRGNSVYSPHGPTILFFLLIGLLAIFIDVSRIDPHGVFCANSLTHWQFQFEQDFYLSGR